MFKTISRNIFVLFVFSFALSAIDISAIKIELMSHLSVEAQKKLAKPELIKKLEFFKTLLPKKL